MAGQSRKWIILVATIWIQAFTGTNFDFSAYSSELKTVLGVSQVQLNYLATASDLGKLFGWSSGLALLWMPLWLVMFISAFMGFVSYSLQWLVINSVITLPYFLVFLLCLLAGCSICWFNTVCFVLCTQNFSENRPLAISLTVSFNGVSAALYTLAADAIDPSSDSLYLLLNALIPLATSIVAFPPILRQPSLDILSPDAARHDSLLFLILNFLAVLTGIYLLLVASISTDAATYHILFAGAIFLLVLPLCIPGVVYAKNWFRRTMTCSFHCQGSGFILVDADDLELHKELITRSGSIHAIGISETIKGNGSTHEISRCNNSTQQRESCCVRLMGKDQLVMLGEEHSARALIERLDFWLYYIAYFCGGTIGLVYSNNLGQIAESLGHSANTSSLISLYSAFSFFGRLLSAAPDYMRAKFYFARTGWLSVALLPTPVAFIMLAASGSRMGVLHASTALVGLSSGFIFAAAVSITSELFGPNSVAVNHNILITNIPIGSLVYGFVAATIYDANVSSGIISMVTEKVVCMGTRCYFLTFVLWGSISITGLVCSVLLFLRTRHAYDHFEHNRIIAQQLQ